MTAAFPPDFEERQFVGERDGANQLLHEMWESMRARGATWMRATHLPDKDMLVIEGWIERPDDDGPEPT